MTIHAILNKPRVGSVLADVVAYEVLVTRVDDDANAVVQHLWNQGVILHTHVTLSSSLAIHLLASRDCGAQVTLDCVSLLTALDCRSLLTAVHACRSHFTRVGHTVWVTVHICRRLNEGCQWHGQLAKAVPWLPEVGAERCMLWMSFDRGACSGCLRVEGAACSGHVRVEGRRTSPVATSLHAGL